MTLCSWPARDMKRSRSSEMKHCLSTTRKRQRGSWMDVKIKEILKAVSGEWLEPSDGEGFMGKVSTDTRTIDKRDLFFALKGVRFDGHDFIKEAIEKGVRYFVISDPKRLTTDQRRSAHFIRVPDTLKAYG